MAKSIEVEPFEASEVGFTLPTSFSFQQVPHSVHVRVIPLALGHVHVRDVGVKSGHVPLPLGLVAREDCLLLLLPRLVAL